MALPAHVLDRLPAKLRKNGLISTGEQFFPAGLRARAGQAAHFGQLLLQGAWPAGTVSELALSGGLSGGTALSLRACRHAQLEAQRGEEAQSSSWCAFVDPSATLHAPGVRQQGIDLDRLLVLRPALEDIARVTLRLGLSHRISLLVVDLVGSPTAPLDLDLEPWVRVVRRLGSALAQSPGRVLLLTAKESPRPLPLPVGLRIEVARTGPRELSYQVTKNLAGSLCARRRLSWGPSVAMPEQQEEGMPHVA